MRAVISNISVSLPRSAGKNILSRCVTTAEIFRKSAKEIPIICAIWQFLWWVLPILVRNLSPYIYYALGRAFSIDYSESMPRLHDTCKLLMANTCVDTRNRFSLHNVKVQTGVFYRCTKPTQHVTSLRLDLTFETARNFPGVNSRPIRYVSLEQHENYRAYMT